MAAEWKGSLLFCVWNTCLSCLAAILKFVNVNHMKCLFIRCPFFVFFGTACFRSPAHVCSRKEWPKRVKTLRKSSKICWKAVIYYVCVFVWFGLVFILCHSISSLGFPSFYLSQGTRESGDRDLFQFLHNIATNFRVWKKWRASER